MIDVVYFMKHQQRGHLASTFPRHSAVYREPTDPNDFGELHG